MLFANARSQKWRELMDELSKISCEDYRNVSAGSAILPAGLSASVCFLDSTSHWLALLHQTHLAYVHPIVLCFMVTYG